MMPKIGDHMPWIRPGHGPFFLPLRQWHIHFYASNDDFSHFHSVHSANTFFCFRFWLLAVLIGANAGWGIVLWGGWGPSDEGRWVVFRIKIVQVKLLHSQLCRWSRSEVIYAIKECLRGNPEKLWNLDLGLVKSMAARSDKNRYSTDTIWTSPCANPILLQPKILKCGCDEVQ